MAEGHPFQKCAQARRGIRLSCRLKLLEREHVRSASQQTQFESPDRLGVHTRAWVHHAHVRQINWMKACTAAATQQGFCPITSLKFNDGSHLMRFKEPGTVRSTVASSTCELDSAGTGLAMTGLGDRTRHKFPSCGSLSLHSYPISNAHCRCCPILEGQAPHTAARHTGYHIPPENLLRGSRGAMQMFRRV